MGQLTKAIGLADLCELLKHAFTFPDEQLVQALSEGSFREDMVSCLNDAGASKEKIDGVDVSLAALTLVSKDELLATLRKEFSLLYLVPGEEVPVFPYEGPFRLKNEGRRGKPALFGSAVSLDVEKSMRRAGVIPKSGHKEPIDSVWNEFAFLSFLYGNLAQAIQEQDEEAEERFNRYIADFVGDHGIKWLPAFMEKTQQAVSDSEKSTVYRVFAQCGLLSLEFMETDVASIPSPLT